MKCMVCGKGMSEGVSLFRTNEKGVPGIWACRVHMPAGKSIDPTVDKIVTIIEDNRNEENR